MNFEWDEAKRRANARKHRVEFADAVAVFDDDAALTMRDEDADEEERFLALGEDLLGRILVVVYTWRGNSIRVISARKATAQERKVYGDR